MSDKIRSLDDIIRVLEQQHEKARENRDRAWIEGNGTRRDPDYTYYSGAANAYADALFWVREYDKALDKLAQWLERDASYANYWAHHADGPLAATHAARKHASNAMAALVRGIIHGEAAFRVALVDYTSEPEPPSPNSL